MDLKKIIFVFLAVIIVFLSYNYLKPMDGVELLNKSDYSVKTNHVNKNNTYSAFKDKDKGKFFIHPGDINAAVGILRFKTNHTLTFKLSINKGSKHGDIKFIIQKNNEVIDKKIVTTTKTAKIIFNVEKGDEVKIIADKHGEISQVGGNIEITTQESSLKLKNFIIPFLWSILFIFLAGKHHTYIAVNSYAIFLLILFAEKLNFGILSFNNILFYMIFLFSMTFIFTFIYQEFRILKKYKIATIVSFLSAFIVYAIPLFFVIYALNFDHEVTKDILYAIFQSNSAESYEYISDFISMKYILLFIFITSVVGILLYRQEKKETLKIEKSLLIFISITFLSITLTQFSQLRLLHFAVEGFEKYSKELRLFKNTQKQRKTGEIKLAATKAEQGETYIIVIGESLNKKHMAVYGYLRNTTPQLSKMNDTGDLLIFNDVYSNHTHTVPVLSLSLTEANQYNKKNYYESLSIIDILKKAEFETYWLTNQTIYGAWDNMISVIASSADHLVTLNTSIGKQTKTQKYDGALIDEVKKVLEKKTDKNRVIFVHLIGNHGSYKSRYPEATYTRYKEKLQLSKFGTKASKNTKINFYDNSIVYNDFVVSSILKLSQNEKGVNGFIYMSDHADDVIGKVGHNSSKFTYEMTQIPMIAWFSDAYKKVHKSIYDNFKEHSNTLYSNDMFYDTLIGMMDIKTDKYNAQYDFTSKDYYLNPKDALVLFRYGDKSNEYYNTKTKRYYTDTSNHIYWQKKNAKYLRETAQSSRIIPHRVNSVGKLRDIWNDGLHSFEVKVRFGDNNTTTFHVGKNHKLMGIDLENFLQSVDYTKIDRVWLDFKNIDEDNYKLALDRLEYLDKKFDIKRKFIVEAKTTQSYFKEIREAGWHTSYYIPTRSILELIKEDNTREMQQIATQIAMQSTLQNISAVSFDNRLYPYIKQYLEPLIDKNIVYHIWYAPSLADTNFKKKLITNKMYLDERVKTLLSTYRSQFNL